MDLPKKIKIAAFDFTISEWPTHEANTDRAYGDCRPTIASIRVDTSIPDKYKVLDTLLHEINHAIYWAYGFEDEDKQERICGTFATAWAAVYRDNPELVEFIQTISSNGQ